MKDLYQARITVTGGRDGNAISSDGKLQVQLGFPPELGGSGAAANPEQLFVAGYAACFASSLKSAAAAMKVPARDVRVEGAGTLSARDDGSFTLSRVELLVHAVDLGDSAEAVLAEAERICAYSNATRGNVLTTVALA